MTETDEQREARIRMDQELARELGLARPYTSGSRVGQCPGGAEYGHGFTAATVHLNCCAEWDARRAELSTASSHNRKD